MRNPAVRPVMLPTLFALGLFSPIFNGVSAVSLFVFLIENVVCDGEAINIVVQLLKSVLAIVVQKRK